MSKTNIIAHKQTGGEVAPAKRSQILSKAKALLADGVALGFRKTFYIAAALHNVKTSEAYKSDPEIKSWSSFCEANGIDRSNSYGYLDIGAKMALTLVEQGVDISEGIQKGHIENQLRPQLDALRGLPFHSLVDLVARLDTFGSAFTSAAIQKLLPASEPTEKEILDGKVQRSDAQEFSEHMRDLCKANGWKWNGKLKRCEHEDGTALTEEEIGRLETPSSALRVWEHLERETNNFLHRVESTIDHHGDSFIRYSNAIPNRVIQDKALNLRAALAKRLEQIDHYLEAISLCDKDRYKEIKKHGIEE